MTQTPTAVAGVRSAPLQIYKRAQRWRVACTTCPPEPGQRVLFGVPLVYVTLTYEQALIHAQLHLRTGRHQLHAGADR